MPRRMLQPKEIVTMGTLKERGLSNRQVAQLPGVTEGTVRYQLRRLQQDRADGRKDKSRIAAP